MNIARNREEHMVTVHRVHMKPAVSQWTERVRFCLQPIKYCDSDQQDVFDASLP